MVRRGRDDVLERGRHIHDFPALWYVHAAGSSTWLLRVK
ncbi:hypothetical protein I552_8711 [Mycobacterium xenopi 3993]|nr:hypothetical protein I552_8711 [Mycobacterium xenopi 3993]